MSLRSWPEKWPLIRRIRRRADRPLHGWMVSLSAALMGPLALLLRVPGVIPPGAVVFLTGAYLSRGGG